MANNPEEKSLPPSKESTDARRKARNQRVQKIIKYLGFSGSGLGLSGTVSLLIAGNWQLALASGTLTIAVTIIAIAYNPHSAPYNLQNRLTPINST